jgi:hypothetical protein
VPVGITQFQPRDRDLQFGRLSGSTDPELLRTIRKHRFQRWFYSSFHSSRVFMFDKDQESKDNCNISIYPITIEKSQIEKAGKRRKL